MKNSCAAYLVSQPEMVLEGRPCKRRRWAPKEFVTEQSVAAEFIDHWERVFEGGMNDRIVKKRFIY